MKSKLDISLQYIIVMKYGKNMERGGTYPKKIVFGCYSGIALSIIFAASWMAAVAVNNDWRFGEDTLSELGGDVPSRWIFNIAVIAAGVLAMPFAIALQSHLAQTKLGRIGGFVFLVASIGLIAVGIFPIDTGRPHTIASVFFFSMVALAVFLIIYPLGKYAGFRSYSFISSALLIIISMVFIILTSIPLAEAITVISLLIWICIMSLWMLSARTRKLFNEITHLHSPEAIE